MQGFWIEQENRMNGLHLHLELRFVGLGVLPIDVP